MPFVTKDWRDSPGDLTTPITAVALEDMETRTTAGIPYENVLWHGAVAGNVGDQTAAIQAAIDACETTGGTVFIPPGTYRMLGSLELHDYVSLVGAGQEASILSWPTSVGAGTWALTPDLGSGVAHYSRTAHLSFKGPGSWDGVTMGGAVSNMNGVKIAARQTLDHCRILNFHRGVGVLEDHLQVSNCQVVSNTYNLAWLAGSVGGGDHHYTSNDFAGASIASVYVESSQGILGSFFLGCHLGYASYCILSATGKSGVGLINATEFVTTPFENFGTAAIWGANATDLIIASQWSGCYASQDPARLLPATTYEFFVRSGVIQTSVFDAANFTPGTEPGTAYFSTSATGFPNHLEDRYEMVPATALRTNTAAFLHNSGSSSPTFCTFADQEGARGIFCIAVGAVTKGQLLMGGGGACRTYDDNTFADVPLGVALQSAGNGEIVPVQTEGYSVLLVADGTIAANRFIKPAATDGRVAQATSWADGPIIGYAFNNNTVGQTIATHIRLGAWG